MTSYFRTCFGIILCLMLSLIPEKAAADREIAFSVGHPRGVQLTAATIKPTPGLVTAQLVVEPHAAVTGYTNCNAITSAHASSVTAMHWRARNHWNDDNDTDVAASAWNIVRAGTPMQSPVQPQPRPSPSYPRTPFLRSRPNNPFVCAFGNASVRPLIGVVRPPDMVVLVVTSLVVDRGISSFVEDTYRMPGAGSQPVTFTNIAVRALWVGFDAGRGHAIMEDFKRRNLSGSLVGYQTLYKGVLGSRMPCILKSVPNSRGPGAISCPAGTKWPI